MMYFTIQKLSEPEARIPPQSIAGLWHEQIFWWDLA
jgi:hypothetical protein